MFTIVAALTALAACNEEQPARSQAPDPRLAAASAAAEAPLKARLRSASEPHRRGVQVFAQAAPGVFAVCGRASASGMASDPLLPYVAVVNFEGEAPQVTSFVLGASGPEATRVFIEMVDRCFEGGGPPAHRMTARALPPLPSSGLSAPPSDAARPVLVASMPTPAEAARPALPTVITSSRHGANIRSSPQGGEVLRTAPRSTMLEVLGEAPGGWVQVGENGEVWGWVHSSVLERAPR